MKRGTIVAVCHDGKWIRRVKGEVLATKNRNRVLVRFPHPETNESVVFWARWHSTIHHQKQEHDSCVISTKHYGYFAGWADIDWFCPWYYVRKWSDIDYHETLSDKKFMWKHGIYK